jgi:uncharacterized protein YeaO (DUF488 family)
MAADAHCRRLTFVEADGQSGPGAATEIPMPTIYLNRVYDTAEAGDGARVLVDRLWPRGLSKDTLKLDLWAKEVAPSTALRQWYHRDLTQYAEFRKRYLKELDGQQQKLDELRAVVGRGPATLLTASKNLDRSHAAVLRELLTKR